MTRGRNVASADNETLPKGTVALGGSTSDSVAEAGLSRRRQEFAPQSSSQSTTEDAQNAASSHPEKAKDASKRQSRPESQDIKDELDRRFVDIRAKRKELEAEVEKVSIERMVLLTLARDIDAQIGSLQKSNVLHQSARPSGTDA